MTTFGAEEFVNALISREGFSKDVLSLVGMAKPHDGGDAHSFMFTPGMACGPWVEIPAEIVEKVEHLEKAPCGNHDHEKVQVYFKNPPSRDGIAFAELLKASLKSVYVLEYADAPRATYPADDADGDRFAAIDARVSLCSCYGPGLYGRRTASGIVLQPSTIGVAHKTMAFGTRLKFLGVRSWVYANVIDRGPFVAGREFDITEATVKLMGYANWRVFGVRQVQWDFA